MDAQILYKENAYVMITTMIEDAPHAGTSMKMMIIYFNVIKEEA